MTDAEAPPNDAERRRWNDEYWTSTWPAREQLTSCATEPLLAAAELAQGQRVLDVGCGCGATVVAAAGRVGTSGRVVGADVSVALLDAARRMASGLDQVTFVAADVQEDELVGAPFDVVVSRFGVMFFERPVRAFTNLARSVVPKARLAFACWQSQDQNPWFWGHALRGFLPPPAPPAPGMSPTGPFAFCDAALVTSVLTDAGWDGVDVTGLERTVIVDRAAIFDEGMAQYLGVGADRLDDANAALHRYAARFLRSDGRLEVPVAIYIVTARAGR
jgi:SAM-dependent methyltransferase